jgi:hypothetical protein
MTSAKERHALNIQKKLANERNAINSPSKTLI